MSIAAEETEKQKKSKRVRKVLTPKVKGTLKRSDIKKAIREIVKERQFASNET